MAQEGLQAAQLTAQRWEQRCVEVQREKEAEVTEARAAAAGARRAAALQEGLRHKEELGECAAPLLITFVSVTSFCITCLQYACRGMLCLEAGRGQSTLCASCGAGTCLGTEQCDVM